jgi:hypothetical protein
LTRLRTAREPALVAVLAIALIVVWHAPRFQHLTSDTFALLNGVGVVDHCLHAHKWACGQSGFGSIGSSPLLQFIPALTFKRLGATYDTTAHGLAWVNTASVVLLLLLLWRTGRSIGDRRLSILLALMAVTSPLLWYSSAGFAEAFAALAVTAFTCAVVTRSRGLLMGTSLWLAAISKEPALPFLLALAFVVLRQPVADGVRVTRGQITGLAVGAVAALATNIGFNAFRSAEGIASGSRPLASSLSHIAAPAPTIAEKAEAAVGLVLAPNVGLLWFWLVALGCIALGLAAAWRRAGAARAFVGTPAFGAVVVFVLFIGGVSSFVAPYGFVAFGPRYLVPWVPSIVVIALSDWPACSELLHRLRAHTRTVAAIAVVIVLLAVSQLTAFLNPVRAYDHFQAGGDCRTQLQDITLWYAKYGEVDSYYRCTRYLAWTKSPVLAKVDAELGSATSAIYLLLYVAAIGTLIAGVFEVPLRRRTA